MSQPVTEPVHPSAPTQAEWDALSVEQRRAVVEALPASVPFELYPPEGDPHVLAKDQVASTLQEFFRKVGKSVYVSKELGTYYPGEPVFCPDVIAVRDTGLHSRNKWVVSDEGKGLDVAFEVLFLGNRKKDLVTKTARYARLGIPEYFVFDRRRLVLQGYRLPSPSARTYVPILPQSGRFASAVLGLDLALEEERIRFYFGTAPLPDADELVKRLERMVGEVTERAQQDAERAQQEAERAQQEAERAQQEAARAEEERERAEEARERANALEKQLLEARAEIERLRQR